MIGEIIHARARYYTDGVPVGGFHDGDGEGEIRPRRPAEQPTQTVPSSFFIAERAWSCLYVVVPRDGYTAQALSIYIYCMALPIEAKLA